MAFESMTTISEEIETNGALEKTYSSPSPRPAQAKDETPAWRDGTPLKGTASKGFREVANRKIALELEEMIPREASINRQKTKIHENRTLALNP